MNWCNFCRTMHPGGDRKPGCPNPDNPSGRLDTMPFPVGAESPEREMGEIDDIRRQTMLELGMGYRDRVASEWARRCKILLNALDEQASTIDEIKGVVGFPGTIALEKHGLSESLPDVVRYCHREWLDQTHRSQQRYLQEQARADALESRLDAARRLLDKLDSWQHPDDAALWISDSKGYQLIEQVGVILGDDGPEAAVRAVEEQGLPQNDCDDHGWSGYGACPHCTGVTDYEDRQQ